MVYRRETTVTSLQVILSLLVNHVVVIVLLIHENCLHDSDVKVSCLLADHKLYIRIMNHIDR